MRQLMDESKQVYEIVFIREKGKATANEMQQSPETSSSLFRRRLGLLWMF
jgi:hypothetical protein